MEETPMKAHALKRVIARLPICGVVASAALGLIAVHLTRTPAYAIDGFSDFKCYSVEGRKLQGVTVTLDDQFGFVETTVTEPTLLCNPACKNCDDADGAPIDETHLVCYKITEAFKERFVTVANQFGNEQILKVKDTKLVCVPSAKFDD